ncbi:Ribosomal silencing factor RsfA (former Iojap) [Marinobacterium lacunae]|uniref:Ribosomal silencing factor RsfS n=1 Tax=Marinobacterium lacunae TaxID=1232683 RepID=A0A081G1A5_9GAMM|nr:ribosome silencing factor [Marinobacterium lacunae]KEA64560.1 Ribosomal silencing factor RsfA (former Iojap) [Marinobacterium lacunae]MBR9882782.1 ribosome silencing factor [Oceanospirillales bacterium]
MQTDQLINLVQNALDDMKARDVVMLDVTGKSSVTDYMLVASGTSKRHVMSVAQEVVDKVKEAGLRPVGIEGEGVGDWVLVDLGDVIVHVMMPDARTFYDIERLWSFDTESEAAAD